ncbi:hypothetical protein R3I94_022708 [Phoxinus phoxinus]
MQPTTVSLSIRERAASVGFITMRFDFTGWMDTQNKRNGALTPGWMNRGALIDSCGRNIWGSHDTNHCNWGR